MRSKPLFAALALALLAVPATLPAQDQPQRERRQPSLRSVGDPGRVAAAEFAFARQARDEGQWTAFRAFAGPGALMLLDHGVVEAATFLAARADPPQSVTWAPQTVWSSCDGSYAISEGRFAQPDGMVGTFITVWALQRDRSYKWVLDVGALDNPQPPPRLPLTPPPPSSDGSVPITVIDIPSIRGLVADCPRREARRQNGQGVPPPPAPQATAAISATRAGDGTADDGTLTWHWEQRANGERLVTASWLKDGQWQSVTSLRVAPTSAE